MTYRCACGASFTEYLANATSGEWACPDCARRWRASRQSLTAVFAGAAELRRLRRDVAVLLSVGLVAVVILTVINTSWLLGGIILVAGLALLARPTYRKRSTRGREAIRTAIEVAPL